MSSKKKADDVDFEKDMPLTAADLEALARARKLRPMTTESYLAWLTLMRVRPARRGTNFASDGPFEL